MLLTNLCANPSFELGTTGWAANPWDAPITFDTSPEWSTTGQACGSISGGTNDGDSYPGFQYTRSAVEGRRYSARVAVKVPLYPAGSGNVTTCLLRFWDANFNFLGDGDLNTASDPDEEEFELIASGIAPPNAENMSILVFTYSGASSGIKMLLDSALLVEGGPQLVEAYFDGDSIGGAWKGTPHASESTYDPIVAHPLAGDRLRAMLAHRYTGDPTSQNDRLLDAIIDAFAYAADRMARIAFGDPLTGAPGSRVLTDPRVAPAWAIGHALQYVGAILPGRKAGETEDEWLARVRDVAGYPLGIRRGSHEAVRRAVQPLLTGTKTVIIEDDYGGPYDVLVRTITSETPDQTAVRAALEGSYYSGGPRGALRAELKLTYLVSDSPTFAEATRQFDDVDADVTFQDATREDIT